MEISSEIVSTLVIGTLLGGSLLTLVAIALAKQQESPGLFPKTDEPLLPLPRPVFIIGGGILLLLAFMHLSSAVSPPSADKVEIELKHVQEMTMTNAVIVGMIFLAAIVSIEPLRHIGVYPHNIKRQIWDGITALMVAIGPVFLVLLVTFQSGLRSEEAEHDFLKLLSRENSALVWFWVGVSAVLFAPLAEELLFRVILQGWLERWLPIDFAIGISSLTFCMVHKFPDSLALIPLALVLGYVYHQRRSFLTIVVTHALFNAINLLLTALAH